MQSTGPLGVQEQERLPAGIVQGIKTWSYL